MFYDLSFEFGKTRIDIIIHSVAYYFRTDVRAVVIDGNFHFTLSAEVAQHNFARRFIVGKILVEFLCFSRQYLFQSVCYTIVLRYKFKLHSVPPKYVRLFKSFNRLIDETSSI